MTQEEFETICTRAGKANALKTEIVYFEESIKKIEDAANYDFTVRASPLTAYVGNEQVQAIKDIMLDYMRSELERRKMEFAAL